jgi:hypothetical protein
MAITPRSVVPDVSAGFVEGVSVVSSIYEWVTVCDLLNPAGTSYLDVPIDNIGKATIAFYVRDGIADYVYHSGDTVRYVKGDFINRIHEPHDVYIIEDFLQWGTADVKVSNHEGWKSSFHTTTENIVIKGVKNKRHAIIICKGQVRHLRDNTNYTEGAAIEAEPGDNISLSLYSGILKYILLERV